MAFQIRISPSAVRAVAQNHHAIADTAANAASELSALTAELGDSWDGGASIQALDALQEIRVNAEKIGDGAHSSAEKLTGVAQAFESLDDGVTAFAVGTIKLFPQIGCPMPRPQFVLRITDNLRIIPEQVRNVASRIRQIAEIYAQAGNDLNRSVSDLSNDWEGNAYNSFAAETSELSDAFTQIVNTLDEFAGQISMIATRYEELDESLRSMF